MFSNQFSDYGYKFRRYFHQRLGLIFESSFIFHNRFLFSLRFIMRNHIL